MRATAISILSVAVAATTSPVLAATSTPIDTSGWTSAAFIVGVVWGLSLLLYFLPSIIAFRRKHPNRWPILLVNLVFGATLIGWIGSMIWAFHAVHKSPQGSNGGESGLNVFVNDKAASPAANPATADLLGRLERLNDLQKSGALTPEEYAGLKRPLVLALAAA